MSDLKIFTENIEEEVVNQIYNLIKQPAFAVTLRVNIESGIYTICRFAKNMP